MIIAESLNGGLRVLLFNLAGNKTDYGLSTNSIVLGLSIGLILPLISNIIPI